MTEEENSIEVEKGQRFGMVPASGKIYDITHADTAEHSVALPAGYPANTKALLISPHRVAGAGHFRVGSVSGGIDGYVSSLMPILWVRAANELFYYQFTVANDDWDIMALGYIVG